MPIAGRLAIPTMPGGKAGIAWVCLVILGAVVLLPSGARAEFALSGGAEYLYWKENTAPIEVKETGPLYAAGIAYTQDRDAGLVFAYRGKLWGGTVDYNGSALFDGTPIRSATGYAGLGNELQLRWRKSGASGSNVDGLFGAGVDAWRRSLSSVQKEDFVIGYLRLGVESGTDDSGKWSVSMGLKYPVWTYENAHLDDIGFNSNPKLRPGKDISPFGSLGYRFAPKLRLVGYYDGFRFSRSAPVQSSHVTQGPQSLVQPASTMAVFGIKLEYRLR